ncbi:von Willebrand factor A domain-containing protein 5A isoform X2 [Sturnira hondurensis]|uniref:von Willebrand factor A domain-containing protein 5A isoform X2 n=1 Tax=Sturnira hondurensis TaxID=192404 RepID=UPI00187A7A36|nr:von Willebrand factor A domain-containing protein 5A isoform X2 [Sturnira hondurensis]
MVYPCGLLTRREEPGLSPVPLKSISVTLSICEFVAGVSATLNYENEENVPLEAFFVFPMDEDSAVYSFEALVDGKKIVAELQDKIKAQANYKEAISKGHQAFLLEEDKDSRDIFSCNVGNLPPGSKAALTLKYVQELALEADGALRYVLPAILNPRYQLSKGPEDSCEKKKIPVVPLEDLPYTLSMVAAISSQHGIERVQSNCPLSPLEYLGDKTSAQISLADGHKFDRDVELLIYYSEVHAPSVAVEMGEPTAKPDCLMGHPSVMVSFYPDIPEAQPPMTCREFVFLVDCSGSMQCPMNNQDKSQERIEAAKETLILLLKSLPVGCYFNIYRFGSTFEAFFQNSVQYTQHTMAQALERVALMQADLRGTEILAPLKSIYNDPSIPGYPLQLFVFTDGEVDNTFSVIKEVKSNALKHRCFSFGIGEGASTSLIKGIARAAAGTAEFITGKERMQPKVLRALKRSLQPVVEDISVRWELPPGLSAEMLSPEQTVIFRGQRLIIYAQLTGMMPPAEATGEVCLKYTLQSKNFENKVTFSLQPKFDANLTIHRLAAKSFLQTKDMGCRETPANDKEEVLKVSLECGVISSYTAFIAVNKDLEKPVQGPLVQRDIPTPMLLHGSPGLCSSVVGQGSGRVVNWGLKGKAMSPKVASPQERRSCSFTVRTSVGSPSTVSEDNSFLQLISLQKADGSWDLNEGLAKILGMSVDGILAALPAKGVDSSGWATVLAVIWLHDNYKDLKCEWELLERKAVTWIHVHAGSIQHVLIEAATTLLRSSVDPAVFSP